MSFALRGSSLLPKNPPENEIARHSSSKQSLFASSNISVGIRHDVYTAKRTVHTFNHLVTKICTLQRHSTLSKIKEQDVLFIVQNFLPSFIPSFNMCEKKRQISDITTLHTKHTNRLTERHHQFPQTLWLKGKMCAQISSYTQTSTVEKTSNASLIQIIQYGSNFTQLKLYLRVYHNSTTL